MTSTASTPKAESPGLPTEAFLNHSLSAFDYPIAHRSRKASEVHKASFARAGHIVHDGGNNDYIVVKADQRMSRHCWSHAALMAFGRQLGVIQ